MSYNEYKINAHVWLYPGMAGWHFATIPKDISDDIKMLFGDLKRGWGSLKVKVTVGTSTWETSIFPDKKMGAYLLPIKADIRKKENILAESNIRLLLEIKV